MEFSDFESPGPKVAAPAPRWSFFREVPWRWNDVLIGFAPLVASYLLWLQVGDVVTSLDDQPVADIGEMARIIRKKRQGDKVSIVFFRGGTAHQVEADLKALSR